MAELLFASVNPADLTSFARELAIREPVGGGNVLSTLLPNRNIEGIKSKRTRVSRTTQKAKFRAFSAQTPVGKRPVAVTTTEVGLIPIGQKLPLREDEIIMKANVSGDWAEVVSAVYDDTESNVAAILNSAESLRAALLFTGIVVATNEENDVIQEADYGLDATHNLDLATVGTAWNVAGADPLNQELEWIQTVLEDAGEVPVACVMSRRIFRALAASEAYTALLGPSRSVTAINALRAEWDLPPVFLYDTKVGGTRLTPDNKIALVTATFAETQWGWTAEALELFGSNAVDESSLQQPAIAASAWKTTDPVSIWSKANATMLPVVGDINGLFVAEVLAETVAS